ncbi:MAG: hypothetical protein ACREJ2_03645 [Planctomycetota bacterium]
MLTLVGCEPSPAPSPKPAPVAAVALPPRRHIVVIRRQALIDAYRRYQLVTARFTVDFRKLSNRKLGPLKQRSQDLKQQMNAMSPRTEGGIKMPPGYEDLCDRVINADLDLLAAKGHLSALRARLETVMSSAVTADLNATVAEVRRDHPFDAVFDWDPPTDPNLLNLSQELPAGEWPTPCKVLYADPGCDITAQVQRRMEEHYCAAFADGRRDPLLTESLEAAAAEPLPPAATNSTLEALPAALADAPDSGHYALVSLEGVAGQIDYRNNFASPVLDGMARQMQGLKGLLDIFQAKFKVMPAPPPSHAAVKIYVAAYMAAQRCNVEFELLGRTRRALWAWLRAQERADLQEALTELAHERGWSIVFASNLPPPDSTGPALDRGTTAKGGTPAKGAPAPLPSLSAGVVWCSPRARARLDATAAVAERINRLFDLRAAALHLIDRGVTLDDLDGGDRGLLIDLQQRTQAAVQRASESNQAIFRLYQDFQSQNQKLESNTPAPAAR